MFRFSGFWLLLLVLTLAGCEGNKPDNAPNADQSLRKPTEDEVLKELKAHSLRTYHTNTPPTVKLLSPLMDVPDFFFARTNAEVDPTAVCCYVAFYVEPAAKSGEERVIVELIPLHQDSGKVDPKRRGRTEMLQRVPAANVVDTAFGPGWLEKHPWPNAKK